MSFSSEIKQELSWQLSPARHCRLAEISAILSFCSHVEEGAEGPESVRMHTENLAVARKYFTLLRKTFNINMSVSVRQNRKPRGNRSYEVISHADMAAVRHVLIQQPCCRRAYIRGAFLASGSVSDPEKGYARALGMFLSQKRELSLQVQVYTDLEGVEEEQADCLIISDHITDHNSVRTGQNRHRKVMRQKRNVKL